MKHKIDVFFGITEKGSTLRKELSGGVTAYLSMSYVIFANPIILAQTGMPKDAVFVATILSSAIAMFIMGIYAKFPLGLAPCMSMNAFFSFSVVLGMGLSWEVALSSVLVAAMLFTFLAISGIRAKIIQAIPHTIKQAGTVGLGLFIAFVSFKNSGIIVPDASIYIKFGGFNNPNVIIALVGIIVATFFLVRGNRFAVFYGMLGAALVGVSLRFFATTAPLLHFPLEVLDTLPKLPTGSPIVLPVVPFKSMIHNTLFVAVKNIPNLLHPGAIITVLTFLFLDFFGTATTLSAAASQIPDLPQEQFENNKKIYLADALGSVFGSILGTSSISTYIESVSGIISGARTGLMAVITGILFLLSLFFYPLLSLVTAAVTTPAMVVIGIFMIQNITTINWHGGFEYVIPAFITIIMMPLTGSIALGLTLGFVAYEFCMIVAGKKAELPLMMHFITVISIAYLFTV